MAEIRQTTTVTLNEDEALLFTALLEHVRLGHAKWNAVAADLLISMTEHFSEEVLPEVYFSFEDLAGNDVATSGVYVTIEVGETE